MFEKRAKRRFGDDDDCSIFVNGTPLELEQLDSAIEALAQDEILQAEEARRESTGQDGEPD